MTHLPDLGSRVCILGRSNAGKSTLALRLSQKTGFPVYHLDQIAFQPCSNWKRKPDADLIKEHDKIMQNQNWIIDGNYSACMAQRFDNATSIIWLDLGVTGSLCRYILRSLKNDPDRLGRLDGATAEFNWNLIRYMIFNYPKNRNKYEELMKGISVPVIRIKSLNSLRKLYTDLEL